ncbi:hypothetical protein SNK05_012962 [Fusarium graminearum]
MSLVICDTANAGRTSLDWIPTEILEIIASNVPSLDTPWNLLRASPRCWRIFTLRYAHITESVLSGSNSITPLLVRELIRAVALVRAQNFPFPSLDILRWDFMTAIARNTNRDEYARCGDTKDITFGPNSLPDSRYVITSVVATAYHISVLAQSVLASCIKRLKRSNLNCLPPDPDPEPRPPYLSGVIEAMGQPTYLEEMRAVRALWIIQLTGEVKAMVKSRPDVVRWTEDEVSRLSQKNPATILPYAAYHHVAVEVRTMMYYLPACYKNDTVFRLPQAPTPSECNRWATMPSDSQSYDEWCLGNESYGGDLLSYGNSTVSDRLPRLGFAFWEFARMYRLGLSRGLPGLTLTTHYRHLVLQGICENTFLTVKTQSGDCSRAIF